MSEFFIVANSFAAPFFSDTSEKFVEADTPALALEKFAAAYTHPCGLYSAACYRDANARAKGEPELARWLSNHAAIQRRLEREYLDNGKAVTVCGHGPGDVEVGGVRHRIHNPKGGAVVCVADRPAGGGA